MSEEIEAAIKLDKIARAQEARQSKAEYDEETKEILSLEHDSTHWPKRIEVPFSTLPLAARLDKRIEKLRPKPAEITKKLNALIKEENLKQNDDPWGLQKLSSRKSEQIQHLRDELELAEKELRRAEEERERYEASWILGRHSEDPILIHSVEAKIADMNIRLPKAVQEKDYETAASLQRNIAYETEFLDAMIEDFKTVSGLDKVPEAAKETKKF